ncbi:MAG: hypothetical protein GF398_01800 [Chitinivibrionales bacterium]|nr:hypothetical protein [Chitinivibrionales bacterium]
MLPLNAQTLTFTSPQAGETACVGDTLHIAFTVDSIYAAAAASVRLSLSVDGGETWYPVCIAQGQGTLCDIPVSPNQPTTVDFALPESIDVVVGFAGTKRMPAVTDIARLKASVFLNPDLTTESESAFTIQNKCPANRNDDDDSPCGKGATQALLPIVIWRAVRRKRKQPQIGY